ncbi:MAG: N-acetylmuramoyl-L-alanine amidase [Phycisphaerales bacterium]|nr:N-acetylmuramoyl-L-alanine amidase [Phycisphaerales bacterium]MCB9863801.1 N-acetylmuramoyl-L-alanine amidase [Phycisphaerales bacterium]
MIISLIRDRRRVFPLFVLSCVGAATLAGGCVGPRPGDRIKRCGDEIVVCGQFFHTGVPVVLWLDPKGYDAYRIENRFESGGRDSIPVRKGATPNRYDSVRRHLSEADAAIVRADGWSLSMLQQYVDLFVLHYDVCGTSRRCFHVLHDRRGLSVHFMLDLDGTIYQTLDLKERAWHAGPANDRSVGVEIANMGAYEDPAELDAWYQRDSAGRVVLIPPLTFGATGLRTAEFVAMPARAELVRGRIHDRMLNQYDLTDAQYASLTRLTATLCRVLPRIRPVAPRNVDGEIRSTVLSASELADFSGILGHYHLSESKVDPGPAFDWPRLLDGVRRCR